MSQNRAGRPEVTPPTTRRGKALPGRHGQRSANQPRVQKDPPCQYEALRLVLSEAFMQAKHGKGKERHAGPGEAFEDQQIVQIGEWMDSTAFAIGQACKKSIESSRLPPDRARAELLGAINYLAAAVIVIDRRGAK